MYIKNYSIPNSFTDVKLPLLSPTFVCSIAALNFVFVQKFCKKVPNNC